MAIHMNSKIQHLDENISFYAMLAGKAVPFPALEDSPSGGLGSILSCDGGTLHLSVHPTEEGRWYAGIVWIGNIPLAVHLGIRLSTNFSESGYTLIPGACYNGNEGLPIKDIPTLKNGRMECPWSEATSPVVLHMDGEGNGLAFSGAPECHQGWNGGIIDRDDGSLWHMAPVFASRRYKHTQWDESPRPPAILNHRDSLRTWFQVEHLPAEKPQVLFKHLFNHYRRVPGYDDTVTPKVGLKEAAHLVGDWMLTEHGRELGGKPCLINAFEPDSPTQPGDADFLLDWHQITGWCGGPMTARGLLALGGEHADYARANLDFLAREAPGEHGLARPVFDGKQWHNNLGYIAEGCSIRMPADFCLWLLRATKAEEEQGRVHPEWKASAHKGVKALCSLWERYEDFGYAWDWSKPEPVLKRGGTTAGAFALLAIVEALKEWPDDPQLQSVARQAAKHLATHAHKGRVSGGPLDIENADDSEAAAALTEALLALYNIFDEEIFLTDALAAAHLFASWVLGWTPPFPKGSALDGVNVCGGVIANVQNRHVGPGICVSSARFLYDLSLVTGDTHWKQLYEDIIAAAINCLPVTKWEMMGRCRRSDEAGNLRIESAPVSPGMLTEQINVADCLGSAGEFWPVSASWGMTSLMLAWAETPYCE